MGHWSRHSPQWTHFEYRSQVGFSPDEKLDDRLSRDWSGDGQNRNLPRFRTSLGSSAILTTRILSKSVGMGPQALM